MAIVLASCVLFWLVVVVAQVAVGRATLWATKALTAAAVAGFSEFVFTWIELEHQHSMSTLVARAANGMLTVSTPAPAKPSAVRAR